LNKARWMDGKHVVFGKVIKGIVSIIMWQWHSNERIDSA
jgi:cyclophilin family peptidyl-prolyl cis-trans isomerase